VAVAVTGLACSGDRGDDPGDAAATTQSPTTEGGLPGTLPPRPDTWQLMPESPLSPRADALLVWTGEDVLVIGGVSEVTCPPNARCPGFGGHALSDGAAFDLVDRQWRPIADPPAPYLGRHSQAAAVGGEAYVLTADARTGDPVLLHYDPQADAWDSPDVPDALTAQYALAGTAAGLVAYPTSDEHGESPDLLYDPAEDGWRELPNDPLPPVYDRTVVGTDDGFVLLAREIADLRLPDPEQSGAAVVATFDAGPGVWERLADSQAARPGGLFYEQGVLVDPHVATYEGAGDSWTAVGGGTLELATGEATALPRPPALGDPTVGGFMWDQAQYSATRGVVFDAATNEWVRLPDLDGPVAVDGRSLVAAGRDAFAFGGARWTDDTSEVLGDAWLWTPPPSAFHS
jgi:hypothetical protein